MSRLGRPKKVHKEKGPQKFVKVDNHTIIEVSVDIPDKVAVKNWLKKQETSKPDLSRGGMQAALNKRKKESPLNRPKKKASDDPGYPRRKR